MDKLENFSSSKMRRINVPWSRRYFIHWHWTFPFTRFRDKSRKKEVAAEQDCTKAARAVKEIQP